MTGDLAAFLAARLDEDEAQPWAVHDVTKCDALLYEEDMGAAAHEHVCDCEYPARVLREVAAKRAILAAYEEAAEHPYDLPQGIHEGRDDWERERDDSVLGELEDVARHIAAVYSDHPDYRQEWAPHG